MDRIMKYKGSDNPGIGFKSFSLILFVRKQIKILKKIYWEEIKRKESKKSKTRNSSTMSGGIISQAFFIYLFFCLLELVTTHLTGVCSFTVHYTFKEHMELCLQTSLSLSEQSPPTLCQCADQDNSLIGKTEKCNKSNSGLQEDFGHPVTVNCLWGWSCFFDCFNELPEKCQTSRWKECKLLTDILAVQQKQVSCQSATQLVAQT